MKMTMHHRGGFRGFADLKGIERKVKIFERERGIETDGDLRTPSYFTGAKDSDCGFLC